ARCGRTPRRPGRTPNHCRTDPRSTTPVITRAQAIDAAHRWINGEWAAGTRRVHSHEFDLGWVVWAEPSPVGVDPLTGERRAPEEIGAACGVVDRETGGLTVWPSVPVDEVVGLYRDSLGAGRWDPRLPPATGRGTRAELTYRDAFGAPRTLALHSAPGLPHPALRAWRQLQQDGVRPEDVLTVHTDLRLSALPGGYWAHALAAELPGAQVFGELPYGPWFHHRAAAVRALPPGPEGAPVPNRVPFPRSVPAGPAVADPAVAARLDAQFGPQGVRRFGPDELSGADLPDAIARTLLTVGVPVVVPDFFALYDPRPDAVVDGSRPDPLLPPVAEHLARLGRGTRAAERERRALVPQLLLGTDGWALITVDTAQGAVRAVEPDYATARHCNADPTAFVRCLAVFADRRPALAGQPPHAAGALLAELQRELAAIDGTVFDDPENWWAVIVEQLWDGLL
ncbi:SUKH-4 family immunity protein, partial [Kitasatospora sp. NPDC054939]